MISKIIKNVLVQFGDELILKTVFESDHEETHNRFWHKISEIFLDNIEIRSNQGFDNFSFRSNL